MKKEDRSLREIAADLKAQGMRCNCDLDTWEPERSSGHSWVCRIHKAACKIKDDPKYVPHSFGPRSRKAE